MVVAMEIGVRIRRLLAISIRRSYKSVCNHPFIVGWVCFLLFLYRTFPFLFSLLVSACPVLVCTAVLLGTLLSFGQSNIPEIEEEEEKVSHEIASLKAGVIGEYGIVVSDESLVVEKFNGEKGDILEKSDEEIDPLGNRFDKAEEEVSLIDSASLINEDSREIQLEMPATKELGEEFRDLLKNRGAQLEAQMVDSLLTEKEDLEHHYSLIASRKDENIDTEDDRLVGESSATHLEYQWDSLLKQAKDGHEEDVNYNNEDDDDESGSDGAESSSPDASMEDIIPLLDELHPLLDEEAPPHAHLSFDGSYAASERSHKSDESVEESEDMENQVEEEDGEDEEDEAAQEGKEDGSKSAIKWTEDDQKNLLDLGTSELERNQRLENLIARRRARKNMRVMAEKNLIDLDNDDLPLSIQPIATTRLNPFDIAYDLFNIVPGSAPSILLPRRNPFDLSNDSGEEKTDLKEGSFQFTSMQPREPIFRRHESFGVGPSVLGGPRQERQDFKWKPYFVPERFATDGVSYPSFQWQLSGISESKSSSVPDSESVSSAVGDDGKKNNEHYFSLETDVVSNIDHASVQVEHGSQSSEVDSVDIDQIVGIDGRHDVVEFVTSGDVESHHEMGSSLSEAERLDISIGELLSHHEVDLSLTEAGEPAIAVDVDTSENHLNTEPFEECSNRSSLSSLSEVDERISDVREEGSNGLNQACDHSGESGISAQLSLEKPEFQFLSGEMEENHHREPIYDSSPPAVEKFHSFSSISSDSIAEISKTVSPPVLAESVEGHSKLLVESTQMGTSGHEEALITSSQVHLMDANESRLSEVSEVEEHGVEKDEPSGVNAHCDNGEETMVPESGVDHVVVDLGSSSEGSEDEFLNAEEENYSYGHDRVNSSILQEGILDGVNPGVGENLHSATSSNHLISDNLTMSSLNEQQPSLVVEHVSVDVNAPSSEAESVEEHAVSNEEAIHHEGEQVQSSCSSDNKVIQETAAHKYENVQLHLDKYQSPSYDSQIHIEGHQDARHKVDVLPSSYMQMASDKLNLSTTKEIEHVVAALQEPLPLSNSDAKIHASLNQDTDAKIIPSDLNTLNMLPGKNPVGELEKQPSWSDEFVVDPSIDVHDQLPVVQEHYKVLVESPREVDVINNQNVWELHDPVDEVSKNGSSLISNSTSVPSESSSYRPSTGILDLEVKILDSVVYEDGGHVSEGHSLMEEYGPPMEQNITWEANELRDIDEGFLSELDRVGDFRVNEVGESMSDEQISEETSVGSHKNDLFLKDSFPRDASQEEELPDLEVRPIEDIDQAFMQWREGSNVKEVILPSLVEDQLVADESVHHGQINSGLPVLEARSIEDIDGAMKLFSESNIEGIPKSSGSREGSAEEERNRLGCTQQIESTNIEPDVQETVVLASSETKHELDG